MTRDEIAADVRDALDDGGIFYTQDDVNDSLQDGYEDISAYSGCIEKATTITPVVNQVYYDMRTLITDFMAVTGIWSKRVKRWLIPVSLRELDEIRENWETANGEPYLYCPINYRYIAIFPAISATGAEATNLYYVFYKAQAPTLAGSTTPEIPDAIQRDILMDYCTMDMFEQAEEWAKAGRYFQSYLSNLKSLDTQTSIRDQERLRRLGGPYSG